VFADVGIIAFVILCAAFVTAVGVIWRALREVGLALRRIEARVQKLHDLSDPNGDSERPGPA
jgi:DMSO/TMAO reductase YedYZ heme-binding membrane subunit